MIDTTVSLIIGYGLLFISELLPLLPIPQQGVLHTLITACVTAATSTGNSVLKNPPNDTLEDVRTIQQAIPPMDQGASLSPNTLDILKDVQDTVKTIQRQTTLPVSIIQATPPAIMKSGEYFPKYPPSNQQQQILPV